MPRRIAFLLLSLLQKPLPNVASSSKKHSTFGSGRNVDTSSTNKQGDPSYPVPSSILMHSQLAPIVLLAFYGVCTYFTLVCGSQRRETAAPVVTLEEAFFLRKGLPFDVVKLD
uniref:Uncharacterized protein n=1 Tax=Odontella aurita TaxID=265563 RepID=A0A6U6FQQ3_9STRA|mmetsp:Transcript_36695/g.110167  ORF Transcript_36695/g.110167 Transcript_36695/m.110167 type:complete len:113 (+) Transcript_36695:563-901(+)